MVATAGIFIATISLLATPAPAASDAEHFADESASATLLAVLLMGVALLYVLNSRNFELRGTFWNVTSQSICTFLGVLTGSAYSSVLAFYVLGPAPGIIEMLEVNAAAMLGWYTVQQFVLGWLAINFVGQDDHVRKLLFEMKCWAFWLGKIAAVSNMAFLGLVQQEVPQTLQCVAAIVPIAGVSLWILFEVAGLAQAFILRDDPDDEYASVWHHFARQLDDDHLSMTLAFLIVQVVRFRLTGELPLPFGMELEEDPPEVAASASHSEAVSYTAQLLLLCAACILTSHIVDLVPPAFSGRLCKWFGTILANSAAFSLLIACDIWIASVLPKMGTMIMVLRAAALTILALLAIIVLHSVQHCDCRSPQAMREPDDAVQPFAILIGFAWKEAAESAVENVADVFSTSTKALPAPLEKFLMVAVLVATVFPAVRLYILPIVVRNYTLELDAQPQPFESASTWSPGTIAKAPQHALMEPLMPSGPPKAETKLGSTQFAPSNSSAVALPVSSSDKPYSSRLMDDSLEEYSQALKQFEEQDLSAGIAQLQAPKQELPRGVQPVSFMKRDSTQDYKAPRYGRHELVHHEPH